MRSIQGKTAYTDDLRGNLRGKCRADNVFALPLRYLAQVCSLHFRREDGGHAVFKERR